MTVETVEIKLLIASDDPGAPQEIKDLLGEESGVRTVYADTGNAVGRAFEEDHIDLALVHAMPGDSSLLDTTCRLVREQAEPVPIVAMIDPEDHPSAMSLAAHGVEGFVLSDRPRHLKRLLNQMIEFLRSHQQAGLALKQLEEIEDRYTLLLDSSSEAIAYLHEGLHVYANKSYLEQFGFESFHDLEGLSMLDLLSPDKDGPNLKKVLKALARNEIPDEAMALQAHRQNGETFSASVSFSPARYNGESCAQMLVREEITQADPALEAELKKLRTQDLLTGLLNSQAFMEELQLMGDSEHEEGQNLVLLFSLDEHAKLQEKLGVSATDALIRQTAALFRQAVGEDQVLARLRDHTFALAAPGVEKEHAERLARSIVDHCSGHMLEVRDTSLTVTASVGLALGGTEHIGAEQLVNHAESALSEALRAGGNGFVRYRPRVSESEDEDDSAWVARLHHALEHDEFRLVSLPITSMEDDDFLINEVETRLRAEESDEVMLPSVYLAAADRVGMAAKLDRDMLNRLVNVNAQNDHASSTWLVPLSLGTITDDAATKWLSDLLAHGKLDASRLILAFREPEIREKLKPAQNFIANLKQAGCRFALCDVGPEASSISPILKHLELDYLRLDTEMTINLSANEELRSALEDITREAARHDIQVIASRVENAGDLASLWQLGITLVQGDFIREETSA